MPPKRKNKAVKIASTKALKTTTTSLVPKRRRHSLEGRNNMSTRLAPSEPLHMTTRRAAKTASNHSSSAASSSAASGSRRSSLNDIVQYEDAQSDIDQERPAKRSRTSTHSGSPQMSNGSFDNNTPMNGTQTPEVQKPASGATLSAPKPAGKKRRASDDSAQSSKTRPNGVLTRTQSDVSEQHPRKKKRKTTDTPADSADQPPELTDASTSPNSPEQIPDVASSQNLQNVLPTNGEVPAKPGRRLPGRRRQPHADVHVEADLRRQLNVKMNYRSLAKVQKILLEELSNRTLKNLQNDPDYHERVPGYAPLMAQLDQRRDARLDQVNAVRTYKLEQLERVRIAEEHIQKEQYTNRFQELQDDFLLQCYFRMKRLEREMNGEKADATDDEDNVFPPTYSHEPGHDYEGRIGSKYASRSRAYVEADNELENDSRRRRLNLARTAFVVENEDADDSIDELAGGYATFVGPDRTKSTAHYNLVSLADAAEEIERTPTPQPPPPVMQIIPNEHAVQLMMLAELSTAQAQAVIPQNLAYPYQQPQMQPQMQSQPQPPQTQPPLTQPPQTQPQIQSPQPQQQVQQHQPTMQHPQFDVPAVAEELARQLALMEALPVTSVALPARAAHNSPAKTSQSTVEPAQDVLRSEPNGINNASESETQKKAIPARVSTHRIMDMLNNDSDVPVYRPREPQPQPQPQVQEPSTPSRREAVSQHNTPSHNNALRQDTNVQRRESVTEQSRVDDSGDYDYAPNNPPSSPHANAQVPHINPQPLQSNPHASHSDYQAPAPAPWSDRTLEQRLRERDPLRKIRELLDKKARRAPPDRPHYSPGNPFAYLTPKDEYDPQNPSVGIYSGSSSTAPTHSSAGRRESQDRRSSHWESDRRPSGSQAPQQPGASPYQGSPPQPYRGDSSRPAPAPSTHQSPYAPPPGSMPLPPKPPGPPPSVPVTNFRFAHYDHPAPSMRPSFPLGPLRPEYQQLASALTQIAPPPPSPHYPPQYGGPQHYQSGYVPPPGSFQAPPPPGPSMQSYPPLKIHQYGGQPILPASMAPPPPQSGPPVQFVGQSVLPPVARAYSPTQGQPPRVHYDQREGHGDRQPEPQSRPRRQYRSYHAPGTQFRSYQGPGEQRRRGG
ncbi:hypothetical protein P153DRAFT_376161 [Dothidotthia symphoricarpi CBS 119687]|uniref:Uncharacterized protein n=1 Tax=Dothidotthia symphoricarpi CBS 119687 TaxID=1392245 RepID=A0A6A6AD28_9PLEO|nr:uncharacterized protein P153DRAFT_376161 [Dothidotthia symphoricarpi CBS 119687]KAF2128777.1 hypothetical protein P153DRAFT_376161 [Dothidotthia symphoricarpi CBS 119687]